MIKISTSILSCKDKIEAIQKLNKTNTDYIHIDVMDGKFVKNKAFPIKEINNILKHNEKNIDIHLMVKNPLKYIKKLNNNKIEFITFHLEIKKNINKIIKKIKDKGYKVGIALKPNTKIEEILPYICDIDLILIMSVEPGYGGQSFIESTTKKLQELYNYKKNIIIEVDGGINDVNIKEIKDFIDIAVVGSFITNNDNYEETINILKI